MVRSTDDGQFVPFLDGRTDPAVRDMLTDGRISAHVQLPDPDRYRLAALKHAYLAACCHLRRIPDSDVATIIRADLKAARDSGRNADVPHSALAAGLGLMRSYDGPTAPPLALAAVHGRDYPDVGEVWISLAGCMLVQWPLPDISPRST